MAEYTEQRPCGCPLDYHLSDCPIISPPVLDAPDPDDFYENYDYEGDDE